MIDLKKIKEQMKSMQALVKEVEAKNNMFGQLLDETIKKSGKEDKAVLEDIKSICQRTVNLAKKGKSEEAKELIKKTQEKYGGKGNK